MKKNQTQEQERSEELDVESLSRIKEPYLEVEVRRLGTTREGNKLITRFETHKTLRSNVKISPYHAAVLNEPRKICEGNTFFVMYLKPGEDVAPYIREAS